MNPYYETEQQWTQEERETLIMDHMPQVRLIARRIHERCPQSVNIEDLVSAGIIGLITAIDNYDPSLNVKLNTYAEFKIRGAILDSLRSLDWAPRLKRKKAREIEAAISSAEKRLQRKSTEEEIAAELNLTIEEYREWLVEIEGIELGSLDYCSSDDSGRTLLEYISDSEENIPSAIFERAELERILAEAIEKMPAVERTVLSLYSQEELTMREIAQVMNMKSSRVSQIKSQAIVRLRAQIRRSQGAKGR